MRLWSNAMARAVMVCHGDFGGVVYGERCGGAEHWRARARDGDGFEWRGGERRDADDD